MKKISLIIISIVWALGVSAQQVMKHRVKRGETMSSVAEKYGMTMKELRKKNPGVDAFYAGMNVNVVDRRGYEGDGYYGSSSSSSGSSSSVGAMTDLELAQNYERSGNYKQAVKVYSRIIDRNPTAEMFFQRGVCYYQNKKWKNAIADFERVLDARDCTRRLQRDSERYLDNAYEQAAIKRERTTNTVAGILAGVVAVGVAADALSSHSHKSGSNGKAPGGGSKGGKGKGGQDGQQGGKGNAQASGGGSAGGGQHAGGGLHGGGGKGNRGGGGKGGGAHQGKGRPH